MSDHPDFSRPANEAVSRLYNFRAQNPLRVTTGPAGYSPSPSPGVPSPSMSPTSSGQQLSLPTPKVSGFQLSRMAIPLTAYAPAYTSAQHAPPTGHMPVIGTPSPSPQPSLPQVYQPRVYPEPLTCLTRAILYDRVYLCLQDNLTEWWAKNPEAMHHLVFNLSNYVIDLGVSGVFGPDGLSSLYQICMYIGSEGKSSYMCLVVQSELGGFTNILTGDLCENDGKNPLVDEELLKLVKNGFDKGAAKFSAAVVTAVAAPKKT